MITTCSNCQTRFRVTAAQLKAASGQVRCSRCQTVFDAFGALQEEITGGPVPLPKAPSAPSATLDAAANAAFDDMALSASRKAAPELDLSLRAGTPLFSEAPPLVVGAKQTRPPMDDMFGVPLDASDRPPPDISSMEAPLPADPPPAEFDVLPAMPPPSTAPVFDIPEARKRKSAAAEDRKPKALSAAEVILAPLESAVPTKAPRRLDGLLWAVGTLLLLLWLAVQLVDAGRASLARNPVIGPSLQALYVALGRPPPSARDPSSWGVDNFNVTSDPQEPGALSITGSLENQGGDAQPWPTLRVMLVDRYGEALRARDFKPAEYLAANQVNALLAAGQATRFRIDVVDPGADAVGFSVAPCIDAASVRVCATTEHE